MVLTCWSFARMVPGCVWVRWTRRPGPGICHLSPCIVPDLMDPGVVGRLEEPTWSSSHLHWWLGGKKKQISQSAIGSIVFLRHALASYRFITRVPNKGRHATDGESTEKRSRCLTQLRGSLRWTARWRFGAEPLLLHWQSFACPDGKVPRALARRSAMAMPQAAPAWADVSRQP